MLRIWRCDCALCVIGNEFPCRQQHNPIRHPLTRAHHIAPRIKTARLRRKTKLLKSIFALDKIKQHQQVYHSVGTCLWHVSMQTYSISAFETCQMRSIPLCPKAVFYVFVFDSIHDSATLHHLSPEIFH